MGVGAVVSPLWVWEGELFSEPGQSSGLCQAASARDAQVPGLPGEAVGGDDLPMLGLRFAAENLVPCLVLLLFFNLVSSHRGYIPT